MKVLIACEFSGVVRNAFKAKGHDAWSCDLLPTELLGNHIQGDVLEILDDGWDLMIAHPPCTYISNAGARFMWAGGCLNLDRFEKAQNSAIFFMQLFNAPINKIAIENPVPLKCVNLPRYNQIVQPFNFGDNFQKKTCLWLKNLPPLINLLQSANPQSTRVPGSWFNKGGKNMQKNRSKTFPGIAKAMAEQWG